MRSFAQGTFPMMTTGSGVVSIMFEITADDTGHFVIGGVKGDAGIIKKILTNADFPGPPDGVFFVELQYRVTRFLYVAAQMVHETSAAGEMVCGPTIPDGLDSGSGSTATFVYIEGGVNALPAPGTRFVIRMDVQTENWGTR